MIRVANVLEEGRFGGPQNYVLQAMSGMKDSGIEVVVVLPIKDSDDSVRRMEEAGVRVVRTPLHRLTLQRSHLIGWFVFFIPEFLLLIRLFWREKIDIVHCNGVFQIKPVLAAWLTGKKTIYHLHNTCAKPAQKFTFRLLRRFCKGLAFASEKTKSTYMAGEEFTSLQGAIIEAPVDLERFDRNNTEPAPKIASRSEPRIVTVANINPDKGIEYFIEMAGIILEKHPTASFHIVGKVFESQKSYDRKLHRQAAEVLGNNVVFHGQSNDVPAILKAADIFVLSSVLEASPMAVWEAMAMALPIVSTDVGDVPVFIKDGKNGFIAPTRDAQALAEKVNILLDDAELRSRFGCGARETAVAELDIAICAARHERLYKTMMGQYNPNFRAPQGC